MSQITSKISIFEVRFVENIVESITIAIQVTVDKTLVLRKEIEIYDYNYKLFLDTLSGFGDFCDERDACTIKINHNMLYIKNSGLIITTPICNSTISALHKKIMKYFSQEPNTRRVFKRYVKYGKFIDMDNIRKKYYQLLYAVYYGDTYIVNYFLECHEFCQILNNKKLYKKAFKSVPNLVNALVHGNNINMFLIILREYHRRKITLTGLLELLHFGKIDMLQYVIHQVDLRNYEYYMFTPNLKSKIFPNEEDVIRTLMILENQGHIRYTQKTIVYALLGTDTDYHTPMLKVARFLSGIGIYPDIKLLCDKLSQTHRYMSLDLNKNPDELCNELLELLNLLSII